jgi:hypothetical protein
MPFLLNTSREAENLRLQFFSSFGLAERLLLLFV